MKFIHRRHNLLIIKFCFTTKQEEQKEERLPS